MAIKIRIASPAKEARPSSGPVLPRPGGRQSGLYLVALRSRVAAAHPGIRPPKLTIPIEPKAAWEGAPEPVKITHT